MKGQSLIEVLVALGIITIIITSIASIVTTSLGNTEYSKDQNTATKYAEEALEVTRGVRNSDYNYFSTLNGTFCLTKNASSLGSAQGSCGVNVDNYFIRKIQIEQAPGCGNNVAKVIATVSWQDGKCTGNTFCHNSNLVSCLSRVNPIQIP